MTPEELDKLAETQAATPSFPVQSAPKAESVQTGLSELDRMLSAMDKMESIINKKIESRILLQNEMQKSIEKNLMERMAQNVAPPEGMDPVMQEGMKLIIELVKGRMMAPPPAPLNTTARNAPQSTNTAKEDTKQPPTPASAASVAAAKPQEGENMFGFTKAMAEQYADQIAARFPEDVKAYQAGKVTDEEAVNKLIASAKEGGNDVPRFVAEAICRELKETDYSEVWGETPATEGPHDNTEVPK